MSDNNKHISILIFSFFFLFFLLFSSGCSEDDQEKFEDYHPWWLEYYQHSDNEVNNALVDIQEN